MPATPVEDVVAGIRDAAPFLTGVTVTGGEATLQAGFVRALFDRLAADPRTSRLTRFVDSNGDVEPVVWRGLAPVTDGVMLDVKALDDEVHVILTGHSNRRVLAGVVDLQALGLLHEVRLLLVPGLNDDDAVLRRTARWLLGTDPGIRVRVNAFRRQGARACARDLLEPSATDLARYRQVLSAAGVRHLTMPTGGICPADADGPGVEGPATVTEGEEGFVSRVARTSQDECGPVRDGGGENDGQWGDPPVHERPESGDHGS
jgi:pyruvate-formate lyase-activating enzyme